MLAIPAVTFAGAFPHCVSALLRGAEQGDGSRFKNVK
jgi:hypothetical protein